jgi:serine/threonine protein kinase
MTMTPAAARDLEERLAAFERSLRARPDDPVDLDEFAPAPGSPTRAAVLTELARLDLELQRERGRPVDPADHLRRFPELGADPSAIAALAFEDYRLRRRAGEHPDPAAYARRFGVDTKGWPAEGPAEGSCPCDPTWFDDTGSGAVWRDTVAMVRSLDQADPRLAAAWAAMPRTGQVFGEFRLGRELGRGAFGRVFLARQGSLAGRRVVLKVVAADGGRDESQTLARLHHRGIMPVYSVHDAGPLRAICMPYWGRHTLEDLLRARVEGRGSWPTPRAAEGPDARTASSPGDAGPSPIPPGLRARLEGVAGALRLGSRLAEALGAAHGQGVIHGDLKPANVLLTRRGEPMLLDFNLARRSHRGACFAGECLGGTIPYMAPEQLEAIWTRAGPGPPDPRADLYALGIILHELLVGRAPFACPSGPLEAIAPWMIQERRTRPVDPRAQDRRIPRAVSAIVRKCLDPDPGGRYPSARDLRADLARHLTRRSPGRAKHPSLPERLVQSVRGNLRAWRRPESDTAEPAT